jgi:hypothetical protein
MAKLAKMNKRVNMFFNSRILVKNKAFSKDAKGFNESLII